MTILARRLNQFLFTASLLALTACGTGTEAGAPLAAGQVDVIKGDGHEPPVCVVDRFKQPEAPVTNKQDILFVMDNSVSMNRHWQLMAAKIGKLLQGTSCKDIRLAVMVGGIEKHTGLLFAAPRQPKVLDAQRMSEAQIMASLKKTFAHALTYDQTDWIGAGEALFYSLYYGAQGAKAEAIRKQGFFRPDAGLNVIFMSDDAEIAFPYPSKQIWDLPPKCNWGHHEKVRKTYYVPRGITADSTFAALRRLKGDMPLVTNAFVNITREDILVDNKLDAKCIYDSPGFGYFDIVKRSGGVLWSIHKDRAEGLLRVGLAANQRRNLIHDFHLSKPAAKVDPASIEARVDAELKAHIYKPDVNVVHLEDAGRAGSTVEIRHCEPVPQHQWDIEGFQGSADETTASLSWLTRAHATSGRVNYGTDPGSLNDTVAHPGAGTEHSVTIQGLAPNTTYYFQAVSGDEHGTEKKSEVISLRTRPAWEVSALRGSAARTQAVLQWDTLAHSTAGYVLFGLAPEQLLGRVPSNGTTKNHSVTVEGLHADTQYFFQAVSFDEHGRTRATNVIAMRTAKDWGIVGLAAQMGRFRATLTWSTPEYPTVSEIRYGIDPARLDKVAKDDADAIEHGLVIDGLAAGTRYYFQAVAKDDLGVVKSSGILAAATIADWQLSAVNAVSTERTFSAGFTTTGFPTSSRLLWGKTQNLGGEVISGVDATEHSATVEGLEPDTLYYYQAVAVDSLGKEMRSAIGSIRTKKEEIPLPKWTISRFEGSATQDTVSLTWLTAEYPTLGTVRFGTSPDSLSREAQESAPAREHALGIAGLSPDTIYYFQVVAADDRGQTQESAVIAVRTQAVPLPVWTIEGFGGSTTQTTASLQWRTAGYDTTATLRYGTSAGSLDKSVPLAGAKRDHAAAVSGLEPGTTYFFQAVNRDDRGQEKVSEVLELRTQPVPLPQWSITGFNGEAARTSVSLTWRTLDYDTTGFVRYGTSAGALDQIATDPALGRDHVAVAGGLSPDTLYFFQAVARDDRGQEKTSEVISVRTLPDPLPAWEITGFSGTGALRSISAVFHTEAHATRGKIRYGTSAGNLDRETAVETGPALAHPFTLEGLNPDTAYFLQAVAVDERGQEKASAVITVRTTAPQPEWQVTGFDGTTTASQANLIWNTPGAATRAVIRVGLTADDLSFKTVTIAEFKTTHIVAVTGLSPDTTYFFQVVAEDVDGLKRESNVISKRTKTRGK